MRCILRAMLQARLKLSSQEFSQSPSRIDDAKSYDDRFPNTMYPILDAWYEQYDTC